MTAVEPASWGNVQAPTGANVPLSAVPDHVEVTPLNFVAEDGKQSKGLYYRRRGTRPKAGVHVMHPRTDQTQNYNILPLVEAGYGVLGRAGRWPNNDVNTIHEPLLLDVAVGVRYLREQGCERVVLLGNSGGSSLATFYQWQATTAPPNRLTHTPAGDAFDLNGYDLPAADGIAIVGGHVGEGLLLGKWLDGSVVDERDPLASDPSLDLFDPRNGFQVPPATTTFSPDFLERYRAAQYARVQRLDALAQSLVDRQREAAELIPSATGSTALRLQRAARAGWHMVIYRTTADPAHVDLSIDPDDRKVGSYSSPRPDLENYGENGFARYLTPRAWLSTWSAISSKVRTADNLSQIREALLIVHYAGDAGARIGEMRDLEARSGATDKHLTIIPNTDHYGNVMNNDGTTGPRSSEGTNAVVEWMQERFQA